MSRSQWPRGLRPSPAAVRLLRLWVWIPPGTWTFMSCEFCVLSGRGLCDGLITRPEGSYRMWCVILCDLETSSRMRRPCPALGRIAIGGKKTNPMKQMNITVNDWVHSAGHAYLFTIALEFLTRGLFLVHKKGFYSMRYLLRGMGLAGMKWRITQITMEITESSLKYWLESRILEIRTLF